MGDGGNKGFSPSVQMVTHLQTDIEAEHIDVVEENGASRGKTL